MKILSDSMIYGEKNISKAVIKAAYKSTCLHSDSFEINIGKSHGNESTRVSQLRKYFLH